MKIICELCRVRGLHLSCGTLHLHGQLAGGDGPPLGTVAAWLITPWLGAGAGEVTQNGDRYSPLSGFVRVRDGQGWGPALGDCGEAHSQTLPRRRSLSAGGSRHDHQRFKHQIRRQQTPGGTDDIPDSPRNERSIPDGESE